MDHSLYFLPRADHAFRMQDSVCVRFAVPGKAVVVKVSEAVLYDFPSLQNELPAQSTLHRFQNKVRKQSAVIVLRYTPFFIMIFLHRFR